MEKRYRLDKYVTIVHRSDDVGNHQLAAVNGSMEFEGEWAGYRGIAYLTLGDHPSVGSSTRLEGRTDYFGDAGVQSVTPLVEAQ